MKRIPFTIHTKTVTVFLAAAAAVGLCFMAASPSHSGSEDESEFLPSEPLKGRLVFEEKYCIKCHSISGSGGHIGPDLGESYFSGTFLDLAALLWNHIPDMVVEYEALNLTWPPYDDVEVFDLFSFLYYLRFLGTPGSVSSGRAVFDDKGCILCHRVGEEPGGEVGPALDRLQKYASPIYVVQALWNHGPEMELKMNTMGIERPEFDGQEISDLSAYIRAVSRWTAHEKIYLSPGDPTRGQLVFTDKGCGSCHAVGEGGGRIGPALDDIDLNKSVTEIASMMWNHGDVMLALMEEEEIAWPIFKGQEMADLIAYLYFIKFRDPPGSVSAGRELFRERQCFSCHTVGGEGGDVGPNLSQRESIASNISILRAMINHAPRMSDTVLRQGKTWPVLTGAEMRDIFAYLKSAKAGAPVD